MFAFVSRVDKLIWPVLESLYGDQITCTVDKAKR